MYLWDGIWYLEDRYRKFLRHVMIRLATTTTTICVCVCEEYHTRRWEVYRVSEKKKDKYLHWYKVEFYPTRVENRFVFVLYRHWTLLLFEFSFFVDQYWQVDSIKITCLQFNLSNQPSVYCIYRNIHTLTYLLILILQLKIYMIKHILLLTKLLHYKM